MKKKDELETKQENKSTSEFDFVNLPHNHKELFFDVIKQRFRTLYFLGLIFFLTILPLIFVLILRDNSMLNVLNDPTVAEEDKNFMMFNVSVIFYPFIFLALMIFPIFLGGILKNLRNLAWEDPIFLKEDFSKGISSSIKVNLLSGFVFALFVFMTLFGISYPGLNAIIRGMLLAILCLIVTPIHLLILYQTSIYQDTYRYYFYNAILIYIRFFFYMLLIGLIFFIPVAFYLFIPNIIIKYTIIMLYLLLLFPLVMLLTQVLLNYVFDKGINNEHYPEIANKGIYQENNIKKEDK